ncbi:hypothetical protein Bhyg_15238 [Pseudolycoriella hygida]|uniref:Uncharacterized protein n=1 Tax=Pseudolycoriella hygida TaxID=35572 RepID=A0A9Q0MRH1_9DIPT|nr:hypothetical protein Bhyg_15238 [Pseudolycoriella hygida]
MLCTKIRLSERRYRNLHEQNDGGPVVRPCSTRELSECITPRTLTKNQRSTVSQNLKTPLVIFTLCISPETETLAPKDVKRDPRKPPPFCQNFKLFSNTNACSDDRKSDTLDFLIRGTEIGGATSSEGRSNDDDEKEMQPIECTCNEAALLPDFDMNLDGYEMDNFGHLPGDSRTPTPNRSDLIGGARCRLLKRPNSPMTEQVIRITMNNKQPNHRTYLSKKIQFNH